MRPANNLCWMLFGLFLLWSGGVHLVLPARLNGVSRSGGHLFFLLREVCQFFRCLARDFGGGGFGLLFFFDSNATFLGAGDLRPLCRANVYLPAGEARGEAHILPAATDGERLL